MRLTIHFLMLIIHQNILYRINKQDVILNINEYIILCVTDVTDVTLNNIVRLGHLLLFKLEKDVYNLYILIT